MNERVKKLGLAFLSAVAIAAVLVWQFSDRTRKEAVLSDSLDLLGQKLISLVPDQAAKKDLLLLFDDFRDKAVQGLLGPKEVEQVAANILNVENAGDTLTRAQAASILPFAFHENIIQIRPMPSAAPKTEKWRSGEPHDLGERLQTVIEFNDRMRKEFPPPAGHPERQRRLHFRVDDNLVVQMDPEFHKFMAGSKRFDAHFKKMEKMEMIQMRQEIEKEIRIDMQRLHAHLDSLSVQLQQMDWEAIPFPPPTPPAIPKIHVEIELGDSTNSKNKD